MLYAPAIALGPSGDEQPPTPRAMPAHTPSPLVPCEWYDQEITHGPASAVIAARQRKSWWR